MYDDFNLYLDNFIDDEDWLDLKCNGCLQTLEKCEQLRVLHDSGMRNVTDRLDLNERELNSTKIELNETKLKVNRLVERVYRDKYIDTYRIILSDVIGKFYDKVWIEIKKRDNSLSKVLFFEKVEDGDESSLSSLKSSLTSIGVSYEDYNHLVFIKTSRNERWFLRNN